MSDPLQERQRLRAIDVYGSTAFQTELPDGVIENFDAPAARQLAQNLGVESADARQFVALAREPAPTEETHATWRSQTQKMLKAMDVKPADLDLARRYVASDPRLHAALDRHGLGDRPDVVERVLQLARQARNSGRLR